MSKQKQQQQQHQEEPQKKVRMISMINFEHLGCMIVLKEHAKQIMRDINDGKIVLPKIGKDRKIKKEEKKRYINYSGWGLFD